MDVNKVLEYLNEAPYVYECIGLGVSLKLSIDGKMAVIAKSRTGGLNVVCLGLSFHFDWSTEGHKWAIPATQEVSAS